MFFQKYVFFLIVFYKHYILTLENERGRNNITVLHEVEPDPLELNTHEVLPANSIKKKPYAIQEKNSEYVKVPGVKSYNAHAVTFDFNLGDLEDVPDGFLPSADLGSSERHLFRNTNINDVSYFAKPLITPSVVSTYVTPMPTEAYFTPTVMDSSSEVTPSTMPPTSTSRLSTSSSHLSSTDVTTSINTYMSFEATASQNPDRQEKPVGNYFNSISTFFGDTDENSTEDAFQTQINVFKLMVNLYDHFFWQPSKIQSNVSPACGMGMFAYLSALNNNFKWAQEAYDSSGHYRGQLLFANNKWLGQYQCCMEVNKHDFQDEQKDFGFDFYVATIHIIAWAPYNLTAEIQLGECLPRSCIARDIETILKLDPQAQMLTSEVVRNSNTKINIKSVRKVPGQYCLWKDAKFIFFFTFCLGLMGVVVTASWYESDILGKKRILLFSHNVKLDPKIGVNLDFNEKVIEVYQMTQFGTKIHKDNVDIEGDLKKNIKHDLKHTSTRQETKQEGNIYADDVELSSGVMKKNKLGICQEILLCFAIQSNARTILSMDHKVENQTSCVHGLRVLSVLWTIMVHTYLQMFEIGENRFLRVITERTFLYQFIGNATFSVDTFFFISGFLVTLLFLKQEKKKEAQNVNGDAFLRTRIYESFLIIVYRYIRLTPAYLFVVIFYELSLRYTFDRSVFQPKFDVGTCSDYWWRNILYINNFFPLNQMCMVWSWYMANDMQFYIMATFLLVFSISYFRATTLILLTCLMSSWGVSGMISIHNNYTHKVANPFESFNFLYDKPWQRVGPYIVGMIVGYVVHVKKNPPKVSNRLNLLLWSTSLGVLFVVVCGVWTGQLNVIATAFYVSIGHTAFGVGLVWVVLSCCWGLASPVNNVLSYSGLLPLSRLTYCTYLVHPVIMLLTSFQMDGTVHLNNFMIWVIFLGNAVVSFVVAFLISMLFEAPVVRLLKIFFKK